MDINGAGVGPIGLPVDHVRGITIAITCDRCGVDREERHPRPDGIAAWVDAAAAVEQALHTAGGCPGTLLCVWELTVSAPESWAGVR